MKAAIFFLALSLSLLHSLAFAGTAYYVDCSAASDGDGTFASPWNNIASVNSRISSMNNGDDIYFKFGTTCTLVSGSGEKLNISKHDGTLSDRAIIGCYDGNGDFDCTGKTYPILDGKSTYPDSNVEGIIHKTRPDSSGVRGYITVKQLYILNPGTDAYGIRLHSGGGSGVDADGTIIVDDVEVDCSGGDCGSAVGLWGNTANKIRNSRFHDMTGGGKHTTVVCTGAGNGLIVQKNVFYNLHQEVVGIYNGAQGIVEKNVLYDCTYYNIYFDNLGGPAVARYNLMYNTGANVGRGRGVMTNNERRYNCATFAQQTVQAYGNIIIGLDQGMNMSDEDNCNPTDWNYFANTLIDNNYSFRTWGHDFGGSGNTFSNNISWTITGGTKHVDYCSPTGISFGHNLWDDDPGTGNCDSRSDPANALPGLVKTSGWRSLTAGATTGQESSLTSGSPAKEAGVSVNGHNERISYCDFTAHPINVIPRTYNTPSIGAMAQEISEFSIPAPVALRIFQENQK